MVQIACLLFMAMIATNPTAMNNIGVKIEPMRNEKNGPLALMNKSDPTSPLVWRPHKNWSEDDNFVSILLIGGCILASIMLIMGTIKGRPSHMIPFMGIQVFHFCITSLTVISYFSYVPNLKNWIKAQDNFPYKDAVMNIDDDWLMLIIVLFSVTILVVEAYLIGIVWSCYKYLCQLQTAARAALLYSLGDSGMTTSREDGEMLLPPKYEDVAELPANGYQPVPPPPYDAE